MLKSHTFAYPKYPDLPWVTISPSITVCPVCGTRLVEKGKTAGKITITMQGLVKERWRYLTCPNEKCPMHQHTFKPTSTLSFPFLHAGIDVLHFILERNLIYKESPETISAKLKKKNVNVSFQLVRRAVNRLRPLLATKITDKIIKELREQGVVVLSLDGVQPEKGKATLWIVSDVISGKKIHVEVLQTQSAESIAEMLTHVKLKLGDKVTVKGVISDGQKAIQLAVEQVFPGVKHQFCQYHFLRDISKPVTDADRNLTKKQRAAVRRIYEYRVGRASKKRKVTS